jgi:CHAT domain-containing protein/Flp pilus assembly protein TadD
MNAKILLGSLFFIFISLQSYAQFDRLLKKAQEKGKQLVENRTDKAREKLDSTDFIFAISVLDNSGIMNVQDWGENIAKGADNLINLNKDDDKVTLEQKLRNTIDAAELAYQQRKYKLAEGFLLDAKLGFETNKLTNSINYSKVYADLGLLYATMGRYNTAESYTKEGLSIREQAPGKASKAYSSSLNNIAVLYQETARYNESETAFKEAIDLIKKQYGEGSQEHAVILNNEAILFFKIGRVEQAIQKIQTAVDYLEKQDKKNIRNQIALQSNLALFYQSNSKFAEAEAIYLKLQKVVGSKSPYYAGILDNLALLYIQMGKLDRVETYFKQAADVYKSKFGDQNPNYAKVQNDLGNFYRIQGRFDEAEKTLTESLTIRTNALGVNHPDLVKSQEDVGILYWKKGDLPKAFSYLEPAMDKSIDFINRYFPPMSEAEKTSYWDVLQPRFQRFYNYCLEAAASNPTVVNEMYDYQMATKGLLLSSTNKVKQAILKSGNTELIKDYSAWLDKKETLARLYALSKEELKEQKIDIALLEQEANSLERSLSQRSTEFSQGYATEKLNYKQVSSLLNDSEAVVELIRIRSFDTGFTSDSKYAALTLTKSSAQPILTVLDNGTQLETRYLKFYRNAIKQKIDDPYSYEQFWSKIDLSVKGKKVLYVSPDGVYNEININTFKKPDGRYVISQYDIVNIGNSKDLIALKSRKAVASKKQAFLLGFPDYGGSSIAALPGTKVELNGINAILKTSGYQINRYEQLEATEARVKTIAGQSLVHIATHGYFQQDVESVLAVNQESAKNNPLLRSGILLAGAAKTLSGEVIPNLNSNDNGVLTAYEAMNLNLDGTDLLVLSACETGLGDIRAGEGVYGLQRAFQVAGAKALLMSLWKVDDTATQALMTNFYTNLAKTGNRSLSFKQAQLQLMVKFKEPYYWGAFVMTGQ